jgi:hypothetical protein
MPPGGSSLANRCRFLQHPGTAEIRLVSQRARRLPGPGHVVPPLAPP